MVCVISVHPVSLRLCFHYDIGSQSGDNGSHQCPARKTILLFIVSLVFILVSTKLRRSLDNPQ